jgi:UDP-N-acetylmuramoyl-L-alanyl-D-glutamate--2,6-diaminopimelate ligase
MTLRDLVTVIEAHGLAANSAAVASLGSRLDVPVGGLAYDSRQVSPGVVFVALKGEHADGAAFVPEAIGRGAVAVVSDTPDPGAVPVPWIQATDGRMILPLLSAHAFGYPSRELTVVGITGTNGKTTTSYLVRAILERAGFPCGLIGTVQYSMGAELFDAPRTTPESLDLQRLLRHMVEGGSRACAMEVSSHALALRRVEFTTFAAAVFTNLTRDHLDYHGDMNQYFEAKQHLFELLPPGAPAVVNIDDPRGGVLASRLPRVVTYGVDQPAAVRPEHVSPSLLGLTFDAITPHGRIPIHSRLAGRFNLYNVLCAVATGVALGLPDDAIAAGLADLSAVPGRLQIVSDAGDDVTVIVDYAHTDDALKNVLEAVRPLATGRLITVFGCGGDRDRTKRPLMGVVAARLSDVVVMTSDNPRSENPERILDDIEQGLISSVPRTRPETASGGGRENIAGMPHRWERNADRRAAITGAVAGANPGDVVVVAGKGHEKYQIIGAHVLPFDDAVVAREALQARRERRPS